MLSAVALSAEMLPDSLHGLLSEIKEAFIGVQVGFGNDAIDRMKPREVRRLIENIFLLYQRVSREYYLRAAARTHGRAPEAIT